MKRWLFALALLVGTNTLWAQEHYGPFAPAPLGGTPTYHPPSYHTPVPPLPGHHCDGAPAPVTSAFPSYHCAEEGCPVSGPSCGNCERGMGLFFRCRCFFLSFQMGRQSGCTKGHCNVGCPAPRKTYTPNYGCVGANPCTSGVGQSFCSGGGCGGGFGSGKFWDWLCWKPAKTNCCDCCQGVRCPSLTHYFRDPCIEGCAPKRCDPCCNSCNHCRTGHAHYAMPTGHGCTTRP